MPEPGQDKPSSHDMETIVSLSGSSGALSADKELPAGYKIGKYRLKAMLGRGGMGTVYEAEDTLLKRPVALKILPEAMTSDEQALRRFVREAQLAARLNHVNAVTVFDIGRKGDTYYIAMELVRGHSVEQELRSRGAIASDRATRIVADCCRSLHAAHSAGLIHRDIKPANILIAADGTVKIADFGLAKLHHAGQDLTLSGQDMIIGTPRYMSPEQAQNQPVDARTDLYALGVTYYAMLTGQPPYDGGTAMQILFAHCNQPVPDPSTVSQTPLPPGCPSIVRKAMAKRKEDRYASAQAMLADLEALLSGAEPAAASAAMPVQDSSAALAAAFDTVDPGSPAAAAPDADGSGVFVLPDMPRPASRQPAKASPALLIGGAAAAVIVAALVALAVVLMSGGEQSDAPIAEQPAPQPTATSAVPAVQPSAVVQPIERPRRANDSSRRVTSIDAGDQSKPSASASLTAAADSSHSPTSDATTQTKRPSAQLTAEQAEAIRSVFTRRNEPAADTPTNSADTSTSSPAPVAETDSADAEEIARLTQRLDHLVSTFQSATRTGNRTTIERSRRTLDAFSRQYRDDPRDEVRALADRAMQTLETFRKKVGANQDGRPSPSDRGSRSQPRTR